MDEKNLEVLRQLQKSMELQAPDQQRSPAPKKPHVSGQGFSDESEQFFKDLAKNRLSTTSSTDPTTWEGEPLQSSIRPESRRQCENKQPVQHSTPDIKATNSLGAGAASARDSAKPLAPLHEPPTAKKTQTATSFSVRGRRGGKCIFRGIEVSLKDYRALKEAFAHMIYGHDQKALKKKQEALQFYLARSPGDREARLILEKVDALLPKGPAKRSVPHQAGASTPQWITKICHWCKKDFVVHKDWNPPPTKCKSCREKLRATHLNTGKGAQTSFTSLTIVKGGAPGLGKHH